MSNNAKYEDYKKSLLIKIKKATLDIEKNAEIYLFGSRARGDFKVDSDWDLLILLPYEVNFDMKYQITSSLVGIALSENQVFNRIYYKNDDWKINTIIHATPFYESVSKEAILI